MDAQVRSMTKAPSKEELQKRLTPLQYHVTQEAGTEHAGTGEYNKHKEPGMYVCVCCGADLFASDEKYDSGSGWPSYWKPADDADVEVRVDRSHGMVREEIRCGSCDAHLGHRFDDGPAPTGQRYCINSASLDFHPKPQK